MIRSASWPAKPGRAALTDKPGPAAFLLAVSGQVLLARALGVAAQLRIADLLSDGPKDAAQLGRASGSDAPALYRILRLLASHEVFAEDESGRFRLTPRAELLREDLPGSLHSLFSAGWQDPAWAAFAELPAAVRNGEVAFELAHGSSFFDYLAAHPRSGNAFDRAMALVAAAENPVIAASFDFSRFTQVADIGGGQGGLLAAILARHPGVRGLLYDQPQVVADPAELRDAGSLDRCDIQAGDFFERVPAGVDLYLLKRILHDWDDATATRILRRCREAMPADGRIAVVDAVMLPGNAPDPNKATDVSIMALTPGRERSRPEFEQLFAAAGLRLVAVHALPLPATLSIIEACAAG